MSGSQLMTNWIRIASEGETVDGRHMERQWLIDCAETYNPELYAALIWPEHENWGYNLGEVLALKAEDVEGVMVLFARLCPSTHLLQANRDGQLLFCSVELTPSRNFRGTGKCYLEGLGVTNTPASVGTDRLRFSSERGHKLFGALEPLVFNEVKKMGKGKTMAVNKAANKNKSWKSIFGIKNFAEDTSEVIPDENNKMQVLAEALALLEARVDALETKTEETDTAVEEVVADVETVKEVVDTEEFATLRDNLPGIIKNFGKLENKVTKLPNKFSKGDGKKPFKFL
ncbi:GPO family capsid scaffolding protein [Yersinia enterocolitica]|uniref:GPO family capsid scaffolding protein n=1 Tax=Yersinia enterocolitica TaxID=630 RepID=UPI0029408AE0|nr:GPO family capsid scaffolding protein [Yersinia enterocolitica]HEN3373979.1 GPO family capsid scaffolding protein [Yersinia enterocolitica]